MAAELAGSEVVDQENRDSKGEQLEQWRPATRREKREVGMDIAVMIGQLGLLLASLIIQAVQYSSFKFFIWFFYLTNLSMFFISALDVFIVAKLFAYLSNENSGMRFKNGQLEIREDKPQALNSFKNRYAFALHLQAVFALVYTLLFWLAVYNPAVDGSFITNSLKHFWPCLLVIGRLVIGKIPPLDKEKWSWLPEKLKSIPKSLRLPIAAAVLGMVYLLWNFIGVAIGGDESGNPYIYPVLNWFHHIGTAFMWSGIGIIGLAVMGVVIKKVVEKRAACCREVGIIEEGLLDQNHSSSVLLSPPASPTFQAPPTAAYQPISGQAPGAVAPREDTDSTGCGCCRFFSRGYQRLTEPKPSVAEKVVEKDPGIPVDVVLPGDAGVGAAAP